MEIVTEKHLLWQLLTWEHVYCISSIGIACEGAQCIPYKGCHQRYPIVRFTMTRGLADQVMYHSYLVWRLQTAVLRNCLQLFKSANLVRAPRCLSKHSHSYGEICCICILKVWDDANFNVGHRNWINHGKRARKATNHPTSGKEHEGTEQERDLSMAKWWKEIQSAHGGATPTPTEPSAYRHHHVSSAPSMSPTADGSGPWIGSKHTLGSPAGHFMYIIVPDFGWLKFSTKKIVFGEVPYFFFNGLWTSSDTTV